MSETILPCPFCGVVPALMEGEDRHWWLFCCSDDGADGCDYASPHRPSDIDAIAAHNSVAYKVSRFRDQVLQIDDLLAKRETLRAQVAQLREAGARLADMADVDDEVVQPSRDWDAAINNMRAALAATPGEESTR